MEDNYFNLLHKFIDFILNWKQSSFLLWKILLEFENYQVKEITFSHKKVAHATFLSGDFKLILH